jgi:hypothetical protein
MDISEHVMRKKLALCDELNHSSMTILYHAQLHPGCLAIAIGPGTIMRPNSVQGVDSLLLTAHAGCH